MKWPSFFSSGGSALLRRQIQTPLARARDQGLPIEPLARVSLIQRAQIPRPLLDLNHRQRKTRAAPLPPATRIRRTDGGRA